MGLIPHGLRADDAFEPNDSRQQATHVLRDEWVSAIQSNDDWYYVESSYYEGGGGMALLLAKCRFERGEGEIGVEVYDHEGNFLGSSSATDDGARIDLLVPGTFLGVNIYYVRVYGANAGNAYSFWWNCRGPGIDLKPVGDASTTISPISIVAGEPFSAGIHFENAGNIDAPAFNIRLWANSVPSTAGAQLIYETRFDILPYVRAFTETGLSADFAFPDVLAPGQSYFILWQLDADGEVAGEAYVDNNVAVHPVLLEVRGTLAQAVDAEELAWSTGGGADWFHLCYISHDLVDAAQSGAILNGESWIETTVTGPGVIRFWWKVSSEPAYDYLIYSCSGCAQPLDSSISGSKDWTARRFLVPAGEHQLRWTYHKDGTGDEGFDAGWLDQVVWYANTPPDQPVPISPANGALQVSPMPTFTASSFSDPDSAEGDVATRAQWQVDDQSDFSSVEWDSETDYFPSEPTNVITLPSTFYKLELHTVYYWRMRYADEHGVWSEWSPVRQFTTEETALSIDPLGRIHDWHAAADQPIQVAANDSRNASSSTNWLRVTSGSFGSGDGTVKYRLDANVGLSARTGTIVVASPGIERTFTVTQNGHDDTDLWGWGANGSGRLGNTTMLDSLIPLPMGEGGDDWKQIAAGGEHTVGIKTDGTLWTWGANWAGQLGDGNAPVDAASPTRVGSASNWSMVAAGNDHTLACGLDGSLWAWGLNDSGQVGDGTFGARDTPVQIGERGEWAAVRAGFMGSAALRRDGSLWIWGYNAYGQVCTGTTNNQNIPVQVAPGTIWKDVAIGFGHVVAIDRDGHLWGWGWNQLGQLGDGTDANRLQPTSIGTGKEWRAVSAGGGHTLGICRNGDLWAWGYNASGQVGDGSTMVRYLPVQIGEGRTWSIAGAGAEHNVAVSTDGSLWAWGYNGRGQVGNGSTNPVIVPTQIGSEFDWRLPAAGYEHNMVVKGEGEWHSPLGIASDWLTEYGLSISGIADYLDLDGDGLCTWEEERCGTDPTNPESRLAITECSVDSQHKGKSIRWRSVTNRIYGIDRSTNLLDMPPFRLLQSGIEGQLIETEFLDGGATNSGIYLYRIWVE